MEKIVSVLGRWISKFKLKSNYLIPILTLSTLVWVASCTKEDDPPAVVPITPVGTYNPTPYNFNLPDYFPIFEEPSDNLATVQGVNFGRHLYYDPMLSEGGPLQGKSCSSCHIQKGSFTSPQAGTSVLAHLNLNYWKTFLWNGKIEGDLEDIMEFEISEFFMADVEKFNANDDYKKLCYEAFGTYTITLKEMSYAMAQFFRALNTKNSKFDRFYAEKEDFTGIEKQGLIIFNSEKGDCFHCHSLPLFTDHLFHNIGLDSIYDQNNSGRFTVTNDPVDYGKFKAPTLRNVELTAPYMHDGRFTTLDEVIEHYNSGVKLSPSLDPIMTKPGKESGLNLNDFEKGALKAFLLTLTDTSITSDPNLADPFK